MADNSYKLKILDLQKQIEAKAKELQKENEKLDAVNRNKTETVARIAQLRDLEATLKASIAQCEEVLKEKKAEAFFKAGKKKGELKDLETRIDSMRSISKVITGDLAALDKKHAQLESLRKDIRRTEKFLSDLRSEKLQLEDENNKADLEIREKYAKLDQRKKDLDAREFDLNNRHTSFEDMRKVFKFYVQRFLRIYRKKGLPLPESIIDLANKI